MRRERMHGLALRLAFGVALAIAWGCGGGGNGGGTPHTGLTATFTPASPTPADGTVTMQAGIASGDSFQVRIVATGVADFFGTGFHVVYDPSAVAYVGADDSGSFLRDDGVTPSFLYSDSSGDLAVSATRVQNAGGTVPGVSVTTSRDLLVLDFRATKAVSGSALTFGLPREVRDSAQPPPGNLLTIDWSGGNLTAR